MARFLAENDLNAELCRLFERADNELIIISPYIKLHDRFRDELKRKQSSDKLAVTLVFGKNEDDTTRSMKPEDLEFFKSFANIEIRYEKRLHAKYYASEDGAILTSMNLYNYSADNNIEAGIFFPVKSLKQLAGGILPDSVEAQAYNYFRKVIENSELIYKRTPRYESTKLGLSRKYTHSDTELDRTEEFLRKEPYQKPGPNSNAQYQRPRNFQPQEQFRQERNRSNFRNYETGYCIRTGVQIPFNPNRPLSFEAYEVWSQFGNYDYPENFCHLTGRPSYGQTTYGNPILRT